MKNFILVIQLVELTQFFDDIDKYNMNCVTGDPKIWKYWKKKKDIPFAIDWNAVSIQTLRMIPASRINYELLCLRIARSENMKLFIVIYTQKHQILKSHEETLRYLRNVIIKYTPLAKKNTMDYKIDNALDYF